MDLTIKIPDVDPKLDPASPEFDPVAWSKALEGRPDFQERMDTLRQRIADLYNSTARAEADRTLTDILTEALTDTIGTYMDDATVTATQLAGIVKAFLQTLAEGGADDDSGQELPVIHSVTTEKVDSVDYPLDKINSNVWNLLVETTPGGQLQFATEKHGSAKPATVLYSINFDELETELPVIKKLTPFDKRVYLAAGALLNSGNAIFSPAMIYSTMGNKSRPSPRDLRKINDSLTKMRAATIYINNEGELSVNRKYNRFVYDGSLLPFERCHAYINNLYCDSAIHVFREPPLITFAKGRKQVTTITRRLLESPVSKTAENLQIDDYLIENIAHIKNGRRNNKILYAKIYSSCGITTSDQKKRAPAKIKRYLEHYRECGFIKSYTINGDGITITY